MSLKERRPPLSDDFLEVTYDKFNFRVKTDYFYHPEECWAAQEGALVKIGVTDYLQKVVGDLIFLELPETGKEIVRDGFAGTIETIKTTVDLFCPVSGRIEEINSGLIDNPQPINSDPYGEGWLFKVVAGNWEGDKKRLMDAQTYFPKMEAKIKEEMAKK
jgi:glycine cleavage system H protein